MVCLKTAHVSNFGREVGRKEEEEKERFLCCLSFCDAPGLCSLQ